MIRLQPILFLFYCKLKFILFRDDYGFLTDDVEAVNISSSETDSVNSQVQYVKSSGYDDEKYTKGGQERLRRKKCNADENECITDCVYTGWLVLKNPDLGKERREKFWDNIGLTVRFYLIC